MLKISYTVFAKYKNHLYCRVRERGRKPLDVNLHTTDRSQAEAYCKVRRQELDLYNSYLLAGEQVPPDVERKLLRRDSPVLAQRGSSKVVSTLRTCLDAWEADLRRRGMRERTVQAYCKRIRLTCPLDAMVTDFVRDNVTLWLSKHDKLKDASRKSYSVALREYAKFLVAHYAVNSAILENWPMVKVRQQERTWWTMPQMARIISAIDCPDEKMKEAMKAYCWVMATVGCRQGELAEVRWTDYQDRSLTIRAETTKSNRTRRVPLDNRICEMLDRLPRDGVLLFNHLPKTQSYRYLLVSKAVAKVKAPAGGLHSFRHSASMHLYRTTNDIKVTSQILGHSPAVALQWYISARESDQLRESIENAYKDEVMIPNGMDRLIEAGLV